MDEEGLFVEPFDMTEEFRRRQRATMTAFFSWLCTCAMGLVWALESDFFGKFLVSLMCVLFGRWCIVKAWPQFRYRHRALRCGPVTGAFEIEDDSVSFVEMTAEPRQTLHSKRSVRLDGSCSMVILERGIGLRGLNEEGDETTLAIMNKMFRDEEARRRFIALCTSRYVQLLRH
ncbi:MAG TPA: hypothetical protein VNI20_01650 [Fimbriimonadaceae bacterium]|nr:hypothetical protein [Fimbriimonadaceae bacterium]